MGTKWLFLPAVRLLGALLILGLPILQTACSLTQTPSPETIEDKVDPTEGPAQIAPTDAIEGQGAGAGVIKTALPIITIAATPMSLQEVEPPTGGNPKLESSLNQLLDAYRQGKEVAAEAFAETHMMVLDNGRVQVEISVVKDAVSDVRAAVEAAGGEYQSHYETLLQALVPLDALESLAQRPDVELDRQARRPAP